ncbi:MAG: AAA family ATPase, partial [Halothece sp.]
MESPLIHHFLIGLPGSGKSTFAKEVLARIYDDSIIISSDRAREELYGEATIQGNWQEIESFIFQQVQSAIAQGKTIIYDATNAKRAHRLEWLQKVETLLDDPPLWMAWQINTPAKQAKQWNKQRDR